MRLNKFLAQGGVASRRKADELISAGKVSVNGKTVRQMGVDVDVEKDNVTLNGKLVKKEKPIIYAIYKPKGVISTVSDIHASQTIIDILPKGKRVYPVGRLDKDSEGLMLVTNDGELANELMHPRYEHEKEYDVTLRGDGNAIDEMKKVREINGSKIEPLRVVSKKELKENEWQAFLVLKEGKKRHIREVGKLVGLKVLRLKRVRIGKLHIGNLTAGKWKIITIDEVL
jgi:23S rRNA pseudouridine2605 synthase